ncbi:MAG: hypothetical protein ACKVOK_08825 [Flavobacteriales bacterium]
MKRTTKLVIALWAMFVAQTAFSQKGTEQQLEKEANALFNKGEFLQAFPMYSQLVSLYPNHPDYNYKFGACAIYSEPDKSKAIKFLTIATTKNVEEPMAWYYLGKAYHLNYQFRESIQAYEQFLRKADPKVAAKTDAQREIETCIYGSNLLANIKDVTVINKTEADKESFFRYFNLESIGGKILTLPDELKTKIDQKATEPGVIHYPGNSTTIYFSSYGKDGKTGKDIYKAEILPDGKFSTPKILNGDVNTKYDEDYCFMHSDGKTLYFASKGHNSMGGYDIFKSVYDPATNSFGPAINLDFAINTPDDDIFFIADSLNQRAYFASARTSDQKHLHVYNVMVENNPLQIIYLKGDFISEINPEQKKATMKINDQMSGRIVMEGSTNQSNGGYVLYVPGAGEYNFKVITENSPTVHEIKVNIPSFGKPVALRQEMRLVSDGGKDKLIVTNYFEEPLNEDLAALAADMLRKKAGLDVNVDPSKLQESNLTPVAENVNALERTIANAPLAAGYSDGTTVASVIGAMENEVATLKKFSDESDSKYANAFAFAQKKQREADIALTQAEKLRNSTSTYASQEDVNKLRESVVLTEKAKSLEREAQAAIASAVAVMQYKEVENARVAEIQEQITILKQAEKTENFDAVVASLNTERQRQSEIKSGNASTPHADLIAKAKAKEAEQQKAEQKLNDLRADEKELTTKLALAETKKNTAKKKSEKQAAETEYVNIKAELDNTRRDIVSQNTKVTVLGEEAKDAFANAAVFKKLSDDTSLGLSASDQVRLTDTERSALEMKLKELDSRADALEVKDPEMLALITDASMDSYATTPRESGSAVPSGMKSRDALSISSDHDILLAKAGTQPEAAPVRRMFIANSLTETNDGIRMLEMKKKQAGSLSVQEEADLKEYTNLRTRLKAELAANPENTASQSSEQIRNVVVEMNPDYNSRVAAINNDEGTEIDHAVQLVALKRETLNKLYAAREQNALQAAVESDQNALSSMTLRDQQYEAAIRQLESETSDVNVYKSAFESENKAVIESDAVFNSKLQDQIEITEQYADVLSDVEEEKQSRLDITTDTQEADVLRFQLNEIRAEKKAAETKLDNYRHDLNLTAATADPKVDSTAVAVNTSIVNPVLTSSGSLEDEIVKSESEWNFSTPESTEGDPQKTQAQRDTDVTEKLFKKREQSESIFAYESSSFEEIVAQHTSPNTELKHRDKIQQINDEIFLIEAEMENEKSESKLRKLDYRAEQLYLRRSLIEIDNSTAIATMAQMEYEEEKKKSDDLTAANQEKLDGRMAVRDQVEQLERQAKSNMQEAATLREIAPSKQDDIERADYYREAFAKEALAIDQLQQIQSINENIDMLLSYDDQQLAQMKAGKSPDADLVAAILAEQAKAKDPTLEAKPETTPSETDVVESATSAVNTAETTSVPAETLVENTIKSTVVDPATETVRTETKEAAQPWDNEPVVDTKSVTSTMTVPVTSASTTPSETTSMASESRSAAPVTPSYEESYGAESSAGAYSASEAEAYYFAAPTSLEKDLFVRTTRAVYSESKPIPMDMEMPKGVYYKVQVGAFRNTIPQNLYDEFAPVSGETMNNGITRYTAGFFKSFDSADQTKREIRGMGYNDAFVVAFRDGKRIPLYEAMGKTDQDFQANVEKEYVYGDKGTAPKSNSDSAPATTSSNGSAKSANYYSGYPDAAKAMQVENIKGLFFTVQVGVYSRPVPPKSVFYINPLNTELTESNKIRYTSGRYKSLGDAVDKRAEAKALGIKDAFITAYYNGKKITLSEADKLIKEKGQSILATE